MPPAWRTLQVVRRVAAWQADPTNAGRRVILMPSVRDVLVPPVHPTPPLSLEGMAPERTSSVQSPAVFACDGVALGATSHDVLLHLSANELWRGTGGRARVSAALWMPACGRMT